MIALELIGKGLLAGLAISAPVGPVNVLCISRALKEGWRTAFISGLGAATADALYGAIAGFSITFVIQLLIREEFWIRRVGGILLLAIGLVYYFKRPESLKEETRTTKKSDYTSAFFLTLTNPTTVLSFLAVLAALHVPQGEHWWLTWLLVFGIFSGSLLWWFVLVTTVDRFRARFRAGSMQFMNRLAGLAIGGFGAFTLFLSFSPSR